MNEGISEILDTAGWGRLARDVRSGEASPQAAIAMALSMPGKFKAILQRAQDLVGKPRLDVRHYVETGKKRFV